MACHPSHLTAWLDNSKIYFLSCGQSSHCIGLGWSEVSSWLAFPWSLASVLCWATIFSDDSKTFIQPWTWCYWTSRDFWMASKFMWKLNIWEHVYLVHLLRESSFFSTFLCLLFWQDKILAVAFEQTLVEVSSAIIVECWYCSDPTLFVHLESFEVRPFITVLCRFTHIKRNAYSVK